MPRQNAAFAIVKIPLIGAERQVGIFDKITAGNFGQLCQGECQKSVEFKISRIFLLAKIPCLRYNFIRA